MRAGLCLKILTLTALYGVSFLPQRGGGGAYASVLAPQKPTAGPSLAPPQEGADDPSEGTDLSDHVVSLLHKRSRHSSRGEGPLLIETLNPRPFHEPKPYTATYRLKLLNADPGSLVTEVQGEMTVRLDDQGSMWMLRSEVSLYILSDGGDGLERIKQSRSTWEAKNGKAMGFASVLSVDGGPPDTIQGEVAYDPGSREGKITYKIPTSRVQALTGEVLFPVAFMSELVRALPQAPQAFSKLVFDGSSETGPVQLNVFVSEPRDVALPLPKDAKPGTFPKMLRIWPVQTAIYLSENREELIADAMEDREVMGDGCPWKQVLDYGNFRVAAVLVKFAYLNTDKVPGAQANGSIKTLPSLPDVPLKAGKGSPELGSVKTPPVPAPPSFGPAVHKGSHPES